jgi:hypothetical protein
MVILQHNLGLKLNVVTGNHYKLFKSYLTNTYQWTLLCNELLTDWFQQNLRSLNFVKTQFTIVTTKNSNQI